MKEGSAMELNVENTEDQISLVDHNNNKKKEKNDKDNDKEEEETIPVAKATRLEIEWITKIERAANAEDIHNIVAEMGVDDMSATVVNFIMEAARKDFECSNCNSVPQNEETWSYNHGTGTFCCPNNVVNNVNGETGPCIQESYPLSFWAQLVSGEAPCQRTLKATAMQAQF
jgi:hypothetical protein